ncbi:MAG: hypothetical protein AAF939_08350 [Planctomycetota bacterium]
MRKMQKSLLFPLVVSSLIILAVLVQLGHDSNSGRDFVELVSEVGSDDKKKSKTGDQEDADQTLELILNSSTCWPEFRNQHRPFHPVDSVLDEIGTV